MSGEGTGVTLAELLALRGQWMDRQHRRALAVAPLTGAHRARAGTQGLEFVGSRPYAAGDDSRTMDWRQTARRGRPYTRLLQDEREQPLWLFVDQGRSMRFATRSAFKSVVAARAAALLAWQARSCGDRVGGAVWDGDQACLLPTRRGDRGVLLLLQALTAPSGTGGYIIPPAPACAGWASVLFVGTRALRPGTRVTILSDFYVLDDDAALTLIPRLRALAQRHPVSLVHVYDPVESSPPEGGVFPVGDGEQQLLLDFSVASCRAAFVAPHEARCRRLQALAQETGVVYVPLATNAALERVLIDTAHRPVRPFVASA